jgi:hypothetical protein
MASFKSLLIELDDELHAALEKFIEDTGNVASPKEAVQAAFRDWAILQGYLSEMTLDEDTPHDGEA